MTPHDIDTILSRLDALGDVLDSHTSRLDAIDTKVGETNGRVRNVELWKAKVEGAVSVGSSPIVAGVVVGIVVAIAVSVLHI